MATYKTGKVGFFKHLNSTKSTFNTKKEQIEENSLELSKNQSSHAPLRLSTSVGTKLGNKMKNFIKDHIMDTINKN